MPCGLSLGESSMPHMTLVHVLVGKRLADRRQHIQPGESVGVVAAGRGLLRPRQRSRYRREMSVHRAPRGSERPSIASFLSSGCSRQNCRSITACQWGPACIHARRQSRDRCQQRSRPLARTLCGSLRVDWMGSADEAVGGYGILAGQQPGSGPSRVVGCLALDHWSRVVALPVSLAERGSDPACSAVPTRAGRTRPSRCSR